MVAKYVAFFVFVLWFYKINGRSANSNPLFELLKRSKRDKETSDNTLHAGRSLINSKNSRGVVEILRSNNHKYGVIMQNDGNFVVYHAESNTSNLKTEAITHNQALNHISGNQALNHISGNPALSHISGTGNQALSHITGNQALNHLSGTGNQALNHISGATTHNQAVNHVSGTIVHNQALNHVSGALTQNDGHSVRYQGGFVPGKAEWSTNTYHRGQKPYKMTMQEDNNLVLYDGSTAVLWSSGTVGKGCKPARLVMQDDGNLVIYDGCGKALWSVRCADIHP